MYELIHGDCIEALAGLAPASVELVLTDIPYGIDLEEWDVLHGNTNSALGGCSPAQARLGSGFRRRGKPINGWSRADLARPREYQDWCASWAGPLLAALKPGGSAFFFCGRRTQHRVALALEDAGFLMRDLLCWRKPAVHFRAQRLDRLFARRGLDEAARAWAGWRLGNLAPRFEPVLWMFRPYTLGGTIADNVLTHGVGAFNAEEGGAGGNVLEFGFRPGERGLHPAQKPRDLLERLVRLTTREGQTVLDPFCGSGSTGVACLASGRRFVGIERDAETLARARGRLEETLAEGASRDGR